MDQVLQQLQRTFATNKIVKLGIIIALLFFSGIFELSAQTQPIINVRFANPRYNCVNNEYCVDVEFQSNTANQSLFGMNVRFFYDDSVLEFVNFRNFANGYNGVSPNPPLITTGNAASGPALFNLVGAAEFVNGAIQLVDANAPPITISTTGWTKLYEVCFTVDGTPNSSNFCPSIVWDLESNPSQGGFPAGDDGVVITVVDPSPNIDSAPAIENVVQYNWQYSGNGSAPFGAPNPTVCISFPCNPPVANKDTPTTPEDTPKTFDPLVNDTDPDNDINPTSVTITDAPNHGTATVNPTTGAITYTPVPGYNGKDTLIYQVCDVILPVQCDTAIVIITITPVNDKPVAVDDLRTTPEDTPITVCVTGNDTDPDGDPLAGGVMIIDPANHGTNVLNPATGCITYTPALNFNGKDTIQYKVCDAGGLCDTAYVIITVTPVNDKPVAVDDPRTTPEDTPITVCVTGNDTDPDGDPLAGGVMIIDPANHGTNVLNPATGCITYTPALNFNGKDTIQYKVCDAGGLCDTAYVIITVTPVNDKPVAVDDPRTTPEDTPITVCVTGNDTDPDGDPLAGGVMIIDPANHGTNVLNPATGCITYTPALNFNGKDTIQYKVCDAGGLCDTAYVIITVTPVNDKPVAVDDLRTTPEDTPITVCVTGNDTDPDGDPLAGGVMIIDPANHGTNVLNPATGCITYTPALNFNGKDTIQYKVCDAGGLCDTAYVIITVTPVNDKPVAVDDPRTTPEDTPITVCVTGNDTDPDGDPLAGGVMIIDPANHGTNVLNPATGCITYTPALNFNGKDTIQYKVCDPGGLCDTAYVIITVTPVNDKPVAVDDPRTTPEDTPITVCVTGNDTDPDGDPLAGGVMIIDPANHGTNVLNPATGCITYTPALNFNGKDTIQYKVCDAGGLCDTAYVIITVTPVNDKPVAVDDPRTTPEDTPITVCVTGNDTDPDGDPLAGGVMIIDPANHGTNVLNPATGCITYTPALNFNGKDTIQYKVCDAGGLCDTAYVIITVTPVNDKPVAVNDLTTTQEDTPVNVCVLPNDSDVEESLLPTNVMILDNANHGTGVFNPTTACIDYTPNTSFIGLDSIQYKVCDSGGLCDTAYVIITVTRKCATIETWVYLEGAAITPDGSATYSLPMRTTLNNLGLLPGQMYNDFFFGTQYTPAGQPYSAAPWNYAGNEGDAYDSDEILANASANYPSTVVDWVLVSLRETANGAGGPACQAAALLHNDGRVEFMTGFKCCNMDLSKSYYVVIEHRNHLIVMSHVPVPIVNGKITYDFRNKQSYINDPLGFGAFSGQKQIMTGKYAMLAGNGNQTTTTASDTDINFDDRSFWETLNGLIAKYRNSDYNLNGDTNFNDRRTWELNNGKFTSVPRN